MDLTIRHVLAASPPTSRSRRTRACGEPNCRSGRTTSWPHRDHTPAGFHPERCRISREIPMSADHHVYTPEDTFGVLGTGKIRVQTMDWSNDLATPRHRWLSSSREPTPARSGRAQPCHTCSSPRSGPTSTPLHLYPAVPVAPGRQEHPHHEHQESASRLGDGRLLRTVNRPRGGRHIHADTAHPPPQRLCPLAKAVCAARRRCCRPTRRRTRPLPPIGPGEAERICAREVQPTRSRRSPADRRSHRGQCSCLRSGDGNPPGAAGAAARCGRGRTPRRGADGTDSRLRERPANQRRRPARRACDDL